MDEGFELAVAPQSAIGSYHEILELSERIPTGFVEGTIFNAKAFVSKLVRNLKVPDLHSEEACNEMLQTANFYRKLKIANKFLKVKKRIFLLARKGLAKGHRETTIWFDSIGDLNDALLGQALYYDLSKYGIKVTWYASWATSYTSSNKRALTFDLTSFVVGE